MSGGRPRHRRFWRYGVAGAVLIAVLAAAAGSLPSASSPTMSPIVEAESLPRTGTTSVVDDHDASGGRAVVLSSSGSRVTLSGNMPELSGITVRANAHVCDGNPVLRLYVDGVAYQEQEVSTTSWADYTFTGDLTAGDHALAVDSLNSEVTPTCRRELIVDKFTEIPARPNSAAQTTGSFPSMTLPGTGCPVDQYRAAYFNNTDLSGTAVLQQCETSVGGNWTGSPAAGVSPDNFSIDYSGTLDFPVDGTYTFAADMGNVGVMVWLDGAVVLDHSRMLDTWGRFEELRTVTAGRHTVRVAIANGAGPAVENFSVSQAAQGPPSGNGRYFAQNSFWNTPLPGDVTVDSRSSRWISALLSDPGISGITTNSAKWTTPVYVAPSGTLRKSILVTNSHKRVSVPYLPAFRPSPDSDAHAAIIDAGTGCLYEFQGFTGNSAVAQASYHAYTGSGGHTAGPAHSGGEFSYVAGLITPRDVSSGVIKHAIRYALPFIADRYSYPGTRADGTFRDRIPEGTLIRLDPSVDVNSLGLNPFQKMVATALQRYGGYNADASSTLSISAQMTNDPAFNNALSDLPRSLICKLQFVDPTVSSVDVQLDRSSDNSCAQQQ